MATATFPVVLPKKLGLNEPPPWANRKSPAISPPSCAVGEPRKTYLGERSFPLIMQNIHRYFLYCALILLAFLAHDVWKAMWFTDTPGVKEKFGIGVGTLIMAINVVMLKARLLVPVVAAPVEHGDAEMAVPMLIAADRRRALPVFSSHDALRRWRALARTR